MAVNNHLLKIAIVLAFAKKFSSLRFIPQAAILNLALESYSSPSSPREHRVVTPRHSEKRPKLVDSRLRGEFRAITR